MSDTGVPPSAPPVADGDGERDLVPTAMRRTADTDRHILQAASLRRRQLRSALLYGSSRSWRQRMALWPAALVGAIAIAVIVAAIAVTSAFEKEQERKAEEEKQQQEQLSSLSDTTLNPLIHTLWSNWRDWKLA